MKHKVESACKRRRHSRTCCLFVEHAIRAVSRCKSKNAIEMRRPTVAMRRTLSPLTTIQVHRCNDERLDVLASLRHGILLYMR